MENFEHWMNQLCRNLTDIKESMPGEELRDKMAMAALNSTPDWIQDRADGYPEIARRCYVMADAMMKARK